MRVSPGVRSSFALRNDPRTGPQNGPHAREQGVVQGRGDQDRNDQDDATRRRLAIDQVPRAIVAVGLTPPTHRPPEGPASKKTSSVSCGRGGRRCDDQGRGGRETAKWRWPADALCRRLAIDQVPRAM